MNYASSLFLTASILMTASAASGQTKCLADENGLALGGYDVVAYHNANSAVRGTSALASKRNGQTFYFSSDENKQAFEKDAEAYLPQYGGYCAFAMAMKSAKAPSDPQTFKLRDGKLYLFYNDFYEGQPFNTIIPWNSDEKEMVAKANANWTKAGN